MEIDTGLFEDLPGLNKQTNFENEKWTWAVDHPRLLVAHDPSMFCRCYPPFHRVEQPKWLFSTVDLLPFWINYHFA